MEKPALSDAAQVLREIATRAKGTFLPIIGPRKGRLLVDEVRKANPRRVLEVGTFIGYSTLLIGKELTSNSELVTIEIDHDAADVAGQNVERANILPKITIMVGNALEIIPTLHGPFNFAFIDAEKTEYLKYLQLAEPKLSKGAVVFADNAGVFAKEMSDYLDYVRNSGKYTSRYLKVRDDGVEISVKQV